MYYTLIEGNAQVVLEGAVFTCLLTF